MKQKIYIVVAVDDKNGIGKNQKLPWHFSKEMKYFKNLTTKTKDPAKKNAVIMGRTTWESIPEKFRPLPNRMNIVLSRNSSYQAIGASVSTSIESAIQKIPANIETIFIIGGKSVFEQGLSLSELNGIYLTKIRKIFDCDTYFPEIPERFRAIKKLSKDIEEGVHLEYLLYKFSMS